MTNKISQLVRFEKIKRFVDKHERIFVPGMLVIGSAADFVTFRSLNTKTAFLILIVYTIIAGASLAFVNVYDEHLNKSRSKALSYLRLVTAFLIQFTFGALLSASLVFYWFSGALSVSWPFLIAIAILMASNEVLRDYFQKPVVQLSVFYFIIFSLFTLILPFSLDSIASWIFILSGVVSYILLLFYIETLSKFMRFIRWEKTKIYGVMLFIFCVMNVLYFTNIIPPIPLSLREAGVYHDLERSGNSYLLTDEKRGIFDRIIPGTTVHLNSGESVYLYSAIFAPENLDTRIVHQWQRFNETQNKWVDSTRSSFQLVGGREDGFRGYSWKNNVSDGRWRVKIENERGQTLGVVRFRIKHTDEIIETRDITR